MPNFRMESIIQQQTNNSDSNYCKMPDGTLIQWGRAYSDSAGIIDVTYNVSFVNPAAYVVCNGYGSLTNMAVSIKIKTYGTTNFSAVVNAIENNGVRALSDNVVQWIAIGRWK